MNKQKKEVMLIGKLLNPKNDYVFKRIFGQVGNEEITKQMLISIIKKEISNIELNQNPILAEDLINDKVGIVDIHAKINKEVDVAIEMQIIDSKNIEKRIMFYWSKLYIQGIQKGEDYKKLHKTIVVLITDFELESLKSIPKFYTKWQIREEKYQSVILTDALEMYIIELPKARRNRTAVEEEIRPWIAFLENPEEVEMVDMSEDNRVAIKKAKHVLEEISQDERELYLTHLREKYILDQNSYMSEGIEKGMEQGMKQGMKHGMQKGKKEIARKMVERKFEMDIIIQLTGLTKEDIIKLK